MNFQTPGMASHPPISLHQLALHIDALKANDNLKFSQEYESIETGQQFTWEHSNLEVNKSKNRYANVIAYDHSRVILEPVAGVPGSDYINSNYSDGYRKRNAYIATQVLERASLFLSMLLLSLLFVRNVIAYIFYFENEADGICRKAMSFK